MEPKKKTQRYLDTSNNLKHLAINPLEIPIAFYPHLGLTFYLIDEKLFFNTKTSIFAVISEFICQKFNTTSLEEFLKIEFKEVDYFFRDKNSEEWLPLDFRGESLLFELKEVLRSKKMEKILLNSRFPSFHSLKIIDKITLVRNILSMPEVKTKLGPVELVDIEDFLIIVNFENKDFLEEKLDWLHQMLVTKFGEPKINVIPEY
jgi:hypothetical protein